MTEIDILKLNEENGKLVFGKEIANTKFAEEFGKTLNEKMPEIIDVLVQNFGKEKTKLLLDILKED